MARKNTENPNPFDRPSRYPANAIWLVGGVLLFMLALGLHFGTAKQSVGAGIKVVEVTRDPDGFVGRTVTVQGEVARVLGARAFVIEDKGSGGQMLVVASADDVMPAGATLENGDDVRVMGEVRAFNPKTMSTEVGLPQGDARLREVTGKPLLHAFQVILPPHTAEEHARTDTARE